MTRATMTATSPDIEHAISQLTAKGWERAALPPTRNAIRKSVNVVRKNVRAEARPHRRTGKMAGSVRTRFSSISVGWRFQGGVKVTGAVANLIVGGVRPHRIEGRGPMPMWDGHGKGSGITGFAQAVNHPGVTADPFVDRGIERSQPAIRANLDAAAKTMAREYAYRMERR